MTSVKKNVIYICENPDNIGDLLLVFQNREIDKDAYQKHFLFCWNLPSKSVLSFLTLSECEILEGKSFLRNILVAKGCDIVIGGGNIVRNNSSLFCVLAYLSLVLVSNIFRNSIFTRGLGAGVVRGRVKRFLYRAILNQAVQVNVRDEFSRSRVESLGKAIGSVVTADMAFFPTSLLQASIGRDRHNILLAPCVDISECRTVYGSRFDEFLRVLKSEFPGSTIYALSHDLRSGADVAVCEDLFRKFPDFIVPITKFSNLERFASYYSSTSLVITNRLHAIILGILTDTPVLVVEDDSGKNDWIAESFHIPRVNMNLATEDFEKKLNDAIDFSREKRLMALQDAIEAASLNVEARVSNATH